MKRDQGVAVNDPAKPRPKKTRKADVDLSLNRITVAQLLHIAGRDATAGAYKDACHSIAYKIQSGGNFD